MFKREFDCFIAYHGTYDSKGAKPVADLLYRWLTDKGYHVFYFPESKRDTYKANIIDVMKSKCFILVSTPLISKTPDGKIDQKEHYELSTEIDAFYALTQFGTDVSVQDSKILVCGDYQGLEGQESKLHELFANRTHFFHKQDTFSEVEEWLFERVKIKQEQEAFKRQQITNEVLEVFSMRSSMSQRINLPQLVASSKMIKAVGISNSELTVKMDAQAIKYALNNEAEVEMLFLDPYGKYTKEREIEEHLRPGKIKHISLGNIEFALDIKETLNPDNKDRYMLYTYDVQPRMNMIILDDFVILQYYANTVAGMSNPCFLVEKQKESSPLYDFCLASYEELKKEAHVIDAAKFWEERS